MIAHIGGALTALATSCTVTRGDTRSGWDTESWELSEHDVQSLVDAYRTLLFPSLDEAVIQALRDDNLPVEQMFYEEEVDDNDEAKRLQKEKITRADMTELAAAASMISVDDAPVELMLLPNVPKGPRRKSESGIDVLSIRLNPNGAPNSLEESERLFVGSVKHSISDSDVGGLRRALVESVSDRALSRPYLVAQIRVFHGRLQERGYAGDRAFLFLRGPYLLSPDHVRVIAVAAVDLGTRELLAEQLSNLADSTPDLRVLRQLLVPNIGRIHRFVQ